jgi:hypothetical protein
VIIVLGLPIEVMVGGVVSMVMDSAVEKALILPAVSVAVAVIEWLPALNVLEVML